MNALQGTLLVVEVLVVIWGIFNRWPLTGYFQPMFFWMIMSWFLSVPVSLIGEGVGNLFSDEFKNNVLKNLTFWDVIVWAFLVYGIWIVIRMYVGFMVSVVTTLTKVGRNVQNTASNLNHAVNKYNSQP